MVGYKDYKSDSHNEAHNNQEEEYSLTHEQILSVNKITTWTANNGVACTICPSILKDMRMNPILSRKSAKEIAPIADK